MNKDENIFNPKQEPIKEEKPYKSLSYNEKILFNAERTAKNVAGIFWIIIIPLILAVFYGLTFLIK